MDELRALRHQKALELLEEPGMRESFRKDLNLTALKEWEEAGEPFEEDEEILAYLEYKKNEARKNSTDSANSESADGVTRQGSIEIGERSSVNGGKQKIGNKYRIILQQSEDQEGIPVSCFQNQKTINYHYIRTINVVVKKQNQTEFLSQSIFLTKILNSLRALDLLDFYIKRNLEVNIRKFAAGKLNLNPSIQPNDLVYKSSCLYVLVLPPMASSDALTYQKSVIQSNCIF
ncbi:unnamed protein product [Rhizophagus irregularis]|nr:unnamed protein product [Rhizophagus irregularis]